MLTKETIRARSVQFKWLVIAVVLIGPAAAVLVAILSSWWPIPVVLLLLPLLVGTFLCSDAYRVSRWQGAVLKLWAQEKLDLPILGETLMAVPGIPRETLRGLLGTLPDFAPSERTLSRSMRTALTLAQETISRLEVQRMAITGGLGLVGLGSLTVAFLAGSWLPLLACFAIPVIGALARVRQNACLRLARKGVSEWIAEAGEASERFELLAEKLDWSGLPARVKERWLGIARI